MSIALQCPKCEHSFAVNEEHEGKLIKCPQCKKPVRVEEDSDRAPVRDVRANKILIEQTSKPLKAIRGVGILLLLVAILPAVLMRDEYGPTNAGYITASVIAGVGGLCLAVGMAMSWWEHG